jgi:hypothetical protein
MTDYKIYTLDSSEHVMHGVDLRRSSDDEAITTARHLVADRSLEVWSGARRVARIDPSDRPSAPSH